LTYAAVSDLTTRFGVQAITELSDPANTGALQTAVVDQALSDADDLINGYIIKIYQLPLVTVPTILTGIAADIALYKLYGDLPTDTATKRYNDAIARLRDIAAGKFVLDVAGVETPQQPDLVSITSEPRRLSRDSLRAW
jgi:phage gp36-like protein